MTTDALCAQHCREAFVRAKVKFTQFINDSRHKVSTPRLESYIALVNDLIQTRDTLIRALDELTDDCLALQAHTSGGRLLCLTASAQRPGCFQLTRFDSEGLPWGDTNYESKRQALEEFLSECDAATILDAANETIVPDDWPTDQDMEPVRPRPST